MESTTACSNEKQTRLFWYIWWLIVATGLLVRWLNLDARPVHHDESLHLMYGRYFFDWPEFHFYKYDPMLHGPLLYNVLRAVYNTLGSTTWAGRSLVCLIGSVFIFAPYFFRRYMSMNAMLALTAAVSLSPTLVYWSRFIREDNLQLGGMLLMLVGICLARGGAKIVVAMTGVAIQFCEKENSFVTMALLAGYLVYEAFFNQIVFKDWKGQASDLFGYVKRFWKESLAGLGLAVSIYSYFYSAGFRYSQGILDGIYRKSIAYWMEQHGIERIAGPFMFHIYMLTWYELLFLMVVLAQMVVFYLRADQSIKIAGGVMLLLTVVSAALSWSGNVTEMTAWKLFKLKDVRDVVGLIIILIQPVIVTTQHLLRRESALAFWGYFFWASLFTYSYLGEKVPWLTVYPFVAGLVYLTLYFDSLFKSWGEKVSFNAFPWSEVLKYCGVFLVTLGFIFVFESGWDVEGNKKILEKLAASENAWFVLAGLVVLALSELERFLQILGTVNLKVLGLVVLCLFNLRMAILVNFTFAGKASEFISQVHTTDDFHNMALKLREEILTPSYGVAPKVLGTEDSVWPITWYMVDVPDFKFDAPQNERDKFDYIFKNWKEGETAPSGFRLVRMNLRGWWVPDYNKMTLKRTLHYAINHRPWSDTGFSYVTLLVKEKQLGAG